MRDRIELDIAAAHKRGVVFFEAHGEKEMVTVLRHSRQLYDTEHERDAFAAGYTQAAIDAAMDNDAFSDANNGWRGKK